MKNEYIKPFERFVFRTPIFHIDEEKDYLNPVFEEALFLASPELWNEKKKLREKDSPESAKLRVSLHKYFSRAQNRCTPFGLFAGCSLGKWGKKTKVELVETENYKRHTRLDMNYLSALIQYLEKQLVIRGQIKYYPNDSIYILGGKIRYIEYYYKGTGRVHQICSVEDSEYLSKILFCALNGATIENLAEVVVDDDIDIREATNFVEELVEAQLLKSELESPVTGDDALEILLNKLQGLSGIGDILKKMQAIRKLLHEIDCRPLGTTQKLYDKIIDIIEEIGVSYELKYLFQTDLLKPAKVAVISDKVVDELSKVVNFLNKITPFPAGTDLSRFKQKYTERYEEQELPLAWVLDKELGIGYPAGNTSGDTDGLVDDIILPRLNGNKVSGANGLKGVLLKKYLQVAGQREKCIVLTDEDFADVKIEWNNMAETFSVMCNIICAEEDNMQFHIKSVGGASAGCLLGRFGHLNADILSLSREIADREQELNPDVMYAELVHIPAARIGNIVARPVLRQYEIHYLATSGVDIANRIPISDLRISVKQGKIVLRSVRFNKEVIPRLSNAHNYKNSPMPVYQFLCDLQMQNKRGGLYFQWNSDLSFLEDIPRVMYRNHILQRAGWNIKNEVVKGWRELGDEELLIAVGKLREIRNLPELIVLSDGDNELLVNMREADSIRAMLSLVKRRPVFRLNEFLFSRDKAVVKGKRGVFTNEFIFAFYKK